MEPCKVSLEIGLWGTLEENPAFSPNQHMVLPPLHLSAFWLLMSPPEAPQKSVLALLQEGSCACLQFELGAWSLWRDLGRHTSLLPGISPLPPCPAVC